ncbi:MAG TPA: DNA repair protein RecN [Brevundimonas sp.]|jgi:DNA repair protein RecN (Recombination protein N)|uniref:DNA repair protein RecN n=1 Tax=Brevundimonas sp. TaxID=1871086 RepID=UPI002D19A18C|nr:DNA repair protein RecN [Brevundimonas sp.]HRH19538.1 DNA repair protein RecN [Brevundimonas sp.]
MLTGLSIRDIVLVEALDLSFGPGLTVLTGETGAGKSIILDALGLATGARADAGLVRGGAAQGSATAIFAPPADHPLWSTLVDSGLTVEAGEDLILRRQQGADGRSRAFINDQPVTIAALRSLGEQLIEVHGQHETVGLLDPRTHRDLLDDWAGLEGRLTATRQAWKARAEAHSEVERLRQAAERAAGEAEDLSALLAELERLDPREGEEAGLAGERALLGAAEKALADLDDAREAMGADNLSNRLASAYRAIERARQRAVHAGAAEDNAVVQRLGRAAEGVDRTLSEAQEALDALDEAARAFDFEPGRLDRAEERLFALRAMARKLGVAVELLPAERARIAAALALIEDGAGALKAAEARATETEAAYRAEAEALGAERREAGIRLAEAVMAELGPLKLDKARFRVGFEALAWDRAGPDGRDRIAFEVQTNPGAPWGGLAAIASGGELARFALALKASLAGRSHAAQPVMIFDEVDQGVGGAVADAVGQRLARLAEGAQVLIVTHSPQVAARGQAHLKVSKTETGAGVRTRIEQLDPDRREEELARMLAGREVTEAARAAARALLG